jgi:hypothetical protein
MTITTATEAPSWPTADGYEKAGLALASAIVAVVQLDHDLNESIVPWLDRGAFPAEAPTYETIGRLWAFVDLLDSEIVALQRLAKELEQSLAQIDAMRAEGAFRG